MGIKNKLIIGHSMLFNFKAPFLPVFLLRTTRHGVPGSWTGLCKPLGEGSQRRGGGNEENQCAGEQNQALYYEEMVFDSISLDLPIIWTAKWKEDKLIVKEESPMSCGVFSPESPWAVVNSLPEQVRPGFFILSLSTLLISLFSDHFLCWSHAGQTLLSVFPGQVISRRYTANGTLGSHLHCTHLICDIVLA